MRFERLTVFQARGSAEGYELITDLEASRMEKEEAGCRI